MSAVTTTEKLVTTMRDLVSESVKNLDAYAALLPALYADAPWKDETDESGKPVKIAAWFTSEFGIGPSGDGYVSLPQKSLDIASAAFVEAGQKPSLTDHVAMTGAARATVARSRARTGLSDEQPQKSPKTAKTPEPEEIADNLVDSDKSEVSTETQEFDLSALLSALDDDELALVVADLGTDRVNTLITNLRTLTDA
jgi:hypothetical protein